MNERFDVKEKKSLKWELKDQAKRRQFRVLPAPHALSVSSTHIPYLTPVAAVFFASAFAEWASSSWP